MIASGKVHGRGSAASGAAVDGHGERRRPCGQSSPVLPQLNVIVDKLCKAINSQQRARIQRVVDQHFSPTLLVQVGEPFDTAPTRRSREEFVDNLMHYLADLPHFHNDPDDASAIIDEAKGRARLFQTNATSGSVHDDAALVREHVAVYDFERSDELGCWLGAGITCLQGPGHWMFD